MATSTFKKEFQLTKKGAETVQKLLNAPKPIHTSNTDIKNVKLTKKRFNNIIANLDGKK
ncbi:MAG: hypothetical protein ACK5K7_06700 [Bacilli bacterium]